MNPVYVSYYTNDYAAVAARLRASLVRWKLDHEVIGIEDRGTWYANCALKPSFLEAMRDTHPGRSLVWIDSDAVVQKDPRWLMGYDCDVAACRWRHPSHKRHEEVLSGTVYIGPGEGGARVLALWRDEIETGHDTQWDQVSLKLALARAKAEGLKVADLPVEYCFITDTHRAQYPDVEPVIEHFQMSRKTRRKQMGAR